MVRPGIGSRTELDRMTRTAGSRPSRRCGSEARRSRRELHSVPSMAACQVASSTSSNRPGGGPPELTTSRSRPPNASTAVATAVAGPSGVDRSAGTASAPSRLRGRIEPVARPGGQPDAGALGPEHLGDGAAQAPAAATDQRATIAQSEIHDRLSWRACRVGTGSRPEPPGVGRSVRPLDREDIASRRPMLRGAGRWIRPDVHGDPDRGRRPERGPVQWQGRRGAGAVDLPGLEPRVGRWPVVAVRRRAVADPGDPVGDDGHERDALVARAGGTSRGSPRATAAADCRCRSGHGIGARPAGSRGPVTAEGVRLAEREDPPAARERALGRWW